MRGGSSKKHGCFAPGALSSGAAALLQKGSRPPGSLRADGASPPGAFREPAARRRVLVLHQRAEGPADARAARRLHGRTRPPGLPDLRGPGEKLLVVGTQGGKTNPKPLGLGWGRRSKQPPAASPPSLPCPTAPSLRRAEGRDGADPGHPEGLLGAVRFQAAEPSTAEGGRQAPEGSFQAPHHGLHWGR